MPRLLVALPLLLLVVTVYAIVPVVAHRTDSSPKFNKPGNILITDQFNNRVIEVDRATEQIVWSFGSGNGMLCNPGPHSIIGTNDAERLSGGLTLMVGTGIPDGIPGTTACVDNRVIVVNRVGDIVWQYGVAGATGSGPNQLNTPVFAIETPKHSIMIVDQGNNRVIEVNKQHQIVWSYGPVSGPGALNNPNSAELLRNGHVLIADENNNRVIEITRNGKIVWECSTGIVAAAFASRLPNGHTLITDSGHARIVEVTKTGSVVFQYFTNQTSDSNPNPLPTNAVRLANGDTAIADQFNNRILIIDDDGHVEFQYGVTNVAGNGPNQLYGPYTAYVIGDYTGQTPPPRSF
ncbi:MAG TPA: PQQ-binding-like beta-propeller repeat protein [Candidatus Bathyarchaeia archaeon]|nr:PQQ-binding-like beta-propeller repeat protein [Candidatus Bathyarchaeia archaeon]